MFLIGLIVVNVLFVAIIYVYNKLTCGICKCSKHLVGKVVIVTGGNSGIGYETAKDLADRGARVILACRDEGRGLAARDKMAAASGNSDVHFKRLDLASLNSVRRFADDVLRHEKRLDVLINNAGIFDAENVKTEDGLLLGMQSNHFGPFLLTCLLLPLLKSTASSRIINVSSELHRSGKLDLNNLNMDQDTNTKFSSNHVYSISKLCNILFTLELSRRLAQDGVTANCLHPGVVNTTMVQNYAKRSLFTLYVHLIKPFFKNEWEGAQTSIYLAVSPEVKDVSGKYFRDCRLTETTSEQARDVNIARKLWEISEKFVKLS